VNLVLSLITARVSSDFSDQMHHIGWKQEDVGHRENMILFLFLQFQNSVHLLTVDLLTSKAYRLGKLTLTTVVVTSKFVTEIRWWRSWPRGANCASSWWCGWCRWFTGAIQYVLCKMCKIECNSCAVGVCVHHTNWKWNWEVNCYALGHL